MRITLTFDNGPEPEATPGVLATLARRGIGATFFLVGRKLAEPACRALAERAQAEGHRLGNHTLTHGVPLGRRTAAEAVEEIARTDALLGALHGPDRLFRPNGGGGAIGRHLLNRAAADHLVAGRHTVVLWNAVPRDFADPDGWPDRAISLCRATDETCLVLHDAPNGAMRHLDRVLGMLADAGARFVQEPPAACVPLARGVARQDFADVITEETMP